MSDDWARLARYVTTARLAAGLTSRAAFETATGVTERTLAKLENGQKVADRTLAAVEPALGWKPGSAHQVLTGGEPDLGDADPLAGLPPALRQAAVNFIQAAVEFAMENPKARGA